MLFRYFSRSCAWAGIALLAVSAVCAAQGARPDSQRVHAPAARPSSDASPAVKPAALPQPVQPARPVDQSPQPAVIVLSDGKLSLKADNSSLIQILDQLGKSSGMSISGLNRDQRVFGVYGPGDPCQILSQLLEGAGYNVLMLGVTKDGTPRNLELSVRGNAPPASPQSFPQQNDYAPPQYFPRPPIPGDRNFPVRSPAQMYQRMQQQRQEQEQQQRQQ